LMSGSSLFVAGQNPPLIDSDGCILTNDFFFNISQ
jgi:hypothetical protein